MTDNLSLTTDAGLQRAIALPSGRTVTIAFDGATEQLTVHDAAGALQLEVRFDEHGPILKLTGARVDLAASKSVTVRGDDVALVAQRSASVHGAERVSVSGGAGTIRTTGDLDLRGRNIHLNP